jgi:hypothetical protein
MRAVCNIAAAAKQDTARVVPWQAGRCVTVYLSLHVDMTYANDV